MVVKYYIYVAVVVACVTALTWTHHKGYLAGFEAHRKLAEEVVKEAASTSLTNTEVLANETQKPRTDANTDECVTFREFHYYTKCVRPEN